MRHVPVLAAPLLLAALAACGGQGSSTPGTSTAPPPANTAAAPSLAPTAAPTPAPTAPPAPAAEAAPEPEGALAGPLRLQVQLDRAGFSPGEIDGRMGSSVERARAAYRKASPSPDASPSSPASPSTTGGADDLAGDGAPTLVWYEITPEDVAGPFVKAIPADMMEKAKLERLGYKDVREALGEKFHASPALLEKLNPGAAFGTAGTRIRVPNVLDARVTARASRLVVDKSEGTLNALDGNGTVIASYPATMGSRHDPLPIGTWKVNGVSRNPSFNYNPDLFWDADESHSKAKIPAGPNNPVGVTWIDLSKEHYGIHGTPEPATIGKTESHGCIRLTNWDVQELAELVSPGIEAVLQE